MAITLRQAIDGIIVKRQKKLKEFSEKKKMFESVRASAAEIMAAKNEVLARCDSDEKVKAFLGEKFIENLRNINDTEFKEKCEEFDSIYDQLFLRYSKEDISISVIGEGRSGKSRLLQSISGLDSRVIPSSASAKDCTGAVSILRNDPDVDFVADVVYYNSSEMVANINQYIAALGGKLNPIASISQVENLPIESVVLAPGDPNAGKMESLEKIVYNYSKWIDGVRRYGETGMARTIHKEDELMQYVAQHNGKEPNEEGYESYFEYLAVKHVVITCGFNYPEAGRIVLRDTVGLGDVRAVGLEDAMMETISNDCDAAMVVMMPSGNRGYRENDDRLYRRLKGFCEKRGLDMGKWFFYVINHTAKESGYGDNIALCNSVKEQMSEQGLLMADSFIVDVSSKDEVKDNLLIPILTQLKENLPDLDRAIEAQLSEKSAEVYEEYKKLFEECQRTADSYNPDSTRVIFEKAHQSAFVIFKQLLGEIKERYHQASLTECERFVSAIRFITSPYGDSFIPSVERIQSMLDMMGAYTDSRTVIKTCMHTVRNELTKRFIEINELLEDMVYDMQREIADLLCNALNMNQLLKDECRPDEVVVRDPYADIREKNPGVIPPINEKIKYSQWLMDVYMALDERFDDPKYNNIKIAIKFISEFTVSVRSFLLHRVRRHIDLMDPEKNMNPEARVIAAGNLSGAALANLIYSILNDLYTQVTEGANLDIKLMYSEPNQLLYAAISEFVDRVIYSFYESLVINPLTGEEVFELKSIEVAWEDMCCSTVFRRSLVDAQQDADMLNAKFRKLTGSRIEKEDFLFLSGSQNA